LNFNQLKNLKQNQVLWETIFSKIFTQTHI